MFDIKAARWDSAPSNPIWRLDIEKRRAGTARPTGRCRTLPSQLRRFWRLDNQALTELPCCFLAIALCSRHLQASVAGPLLRVPKRRSSLLKPVKLLALVGGNYEWRNRGWNSLPRAG